MFELPPLAQELWLLVVGAAVLLTMAIAWLALRVKYKAQVAVLGFFVHTHGLQHGLRINGILQSNG